MEAENLVGRKFQVTSVHESKESLIIQLRDLESGTEHELRVIDASGKGADSGWYNWAEVHFDGSTIFKT